jgi:hypothetical protein
MSKHLSNPTPRLICMGGAKASTMASNVGEPEFDIGGPQQLD